MKDNFKICAVIPAFNEEKTISDVIYSLKIQLPEAEIVVINDGSKDGTVQVAEAAGATVISLGFNLGIGGAVQTGLKYAHREHFDAMLEVDADGQHDPIDSSRLITALRESSAHMVIGSRFVENTAYRSSVLRRFGVHLFSWLIKLVTGQRIYDSTSGFRAYDARAIAFLANRYPTDFPEPESIVMLLINGFRIKEIPVEMHDRTAGVSVVGHDISWRALYFVISNAIAILISGLKPKRSYAR